MWGRTHRFHGHVARVDVGVLSILVEGLFGRLGARRESARWEGRRRKRGTFRASLIAETVVAPTFTPSEIPAAGVYHRRELYHTDNLSRRDTCSIVWQKADIGMTWGDDRCNPHHPLFSSLQPHAEATAPGLHQCTRWLQATVSTGVGVPPHRSG